MKHERTSEPKQRRDQATRITIWRLTPAARKLVLVVHVISSIGWMGVDIALVVLLITARTTNDALLVISGLLRHAWRCYCPIYL